jgi:hypothetical protein
MMLIHTVAAGGGSILHADHGRFVVGPDSAGADPGPRSYRRGGPLTVTDANVMVGKLDPAHFPRIFGPDRDQPLDVEAVRAAFMALAADIGQGRSPEDVAEGFLRIAVENMAFIMVLMVIYPVAYAAQGAAMRAALGWMGGGFAISLGLFYALFQSPMLWQSNFCDALSAVHMRAAIMGGTAMVLLAAYDRWRKPGLGQRMIVIGLAGLLAALPLFFDRHCFLDPFSRFN